MQIHSSRFGTITFQADEVLTFSDGFCGDPDDRHYLLLADGGHRRLWWLQSIVRPDVARPVTCDSASPVQRARTGAGQPTAGSTVTLWLLVGEPNRVRIDRERPILINVRTLRASQRSDRGNQALQHARPHQAASLRKSA